MTKTKYRVFDYKNNFHQSYDAALQGAFAWAHDCAKRVHGYVLQYDGEELDAVDGGRKIIDFTAEKLQKLANK
jgi:hypothetical protein